MKLSGKPITRAPFAPASRISRQAFSVEPSRSRNTDAAWTAATFTTPYRSPIWRALLRCLGLRRRRLLRPVIGLLLGGLQRVHGLEARRHRAVLPGKNLVVL